MWQLYVAGFLALSALVLAGVYIWSDLQAEAGPIVALRPLCTLAVAIVAMMAPMPVSLFFKGAIVLGLLLSLVADGLLAIESTPPVIGAGIYLVVYFLYLLAFSSQTVWQIPTVWVLPLILYAGWWWLRLAPSFREVRGAVLAYTVMLGLMVWQALELAVQRGEPWAFVALAAALIFGLADSMRGIVLLRGPINGGDAIALSAYFLGQWLIAFSLWGGALPWLT